jgi:hypothetical protein
VLVFLLSLFIEEFEKLEIWPFGQCTSLIEVIIESTSLIIENHCFINCFSLEKITNLNPNLHLDPNLFLGTLYYSNFIFSTFFQELNEIPSLNESVCPLCEKGLNELSKPYMIKRCKHISCKNCLVYLLNSSKKYGICNFDFI